MYLPRTAFSWWGPPRTKARKNLHRNNDNVKAVSPPNYFKRMHPHVSLYNADLLEGHKITACAWDLGEVETWGPSRGTLWVRIPAITRMGGLPRHERRWYSLHILCLRSSGMGPIKIEPSSIGDIMLNISPGHFIFQMVQWVLLLPCDFWGRGVKQIGPRCNCLMGGRARI